MKIAYLINQYPKISHSFIRREIQQLEKIALQISRFSIRFSQDELVDQEDKQEFEKTKFILDVGIRGLLIYLLKNIVLNPLNFIKVLFFSCQIGYGSDRGILRHLAYLAEACVLSFWLKEAGIKHIHAHFGTNSTTVAMLCSMLSDCTYSFTVHGPEEFDKVVAIALPEKIKRAKFIIAISSFGRSQLYRWCNYQDWQKIHVVRCGLDQKFLSASVTSITNENRFVCIGRLCEQKGQLLLVKAIANLKEEGIECRLVLVGDGELRSPIEHLIEKFDLQNEITITGWASSDDVKEEILKAKAMILPSFAEGLPVVIMESLALARPVITTYIAGTPELIENNVNGWLIPAGDIQALTNMIKQVLILPSEKLEQMGKNGKQKVILEHNIETEVTKLAHLFKQT